MVKLQFEKYRAKEGQAKRKGMLHTTECREPENLPDATGNPRLIYFFPSPPSHPLRDIFKTVPLPLKQTVS